MVARFVLAVGLDALLSWAIRLLVGLVVAALVVALIVVQTVAGVLSGGRTGDAAAAPTTVVARGPTALPVPNARPPLPSDSGVSIVGLAQSWLGVPYAFGGCSRAGVDCSCLVQNVYAAVGIHLPRIAVDQFNATAPTDDPQPGDLVFFANTYEPGVSHVGIYVGHGLQINAPTTGAVVSVASVFTGYWGAHYVGAHRVRAS